MELEAPPNDAENPAGDANMGPVETTVGSVSSWPAYGGGGGGMGRLCCDWLRDWVEVS
jgi:hypothetical protein